MRILLIHQMFLEEDDPGGSRFSEMTKSWIEAGHEVTVLAGMVHYNGSKKRREYEKKYFVRKTQGKVIVWRCHVSESYNSNFIGRLWGYFSFMFAASWAGIFKVKGNFDIILATSPPLFEGITAYVISRFKKAPYVFEVRDLWPESAIDTGVLTNKLIINLSFKVEKFIYKKATLINVLTPAFRDHLINKKAIPADKIILIPNAADFTLTENLLHEFDSVAFREELGWSQKFIITYVGAHGIANHLDQILDAAVILKNTIVHFVLIGAGMDKPRLLQRAQQLKIPNITFLDPIPKKDIFKYILASDVGTSVLKKVDTFKTVYSNKTFDYMACKKPVILAIDGVSRELIEEAKAGTYVEPEDSVAYSKAVISYLETPQKIAIEGENGYNYARKNFNRTDLTKKYLAFLEQVAVS